MPSRGDAAAAARASHRRHRRHRRRLNVQVARRRGAPRCFLSFSRVFLFFSLSLVFLDRERFSQLLRVFFDFVFLKLTSDQNLCVEFFCCSTTRSVGVVVSFCFLFFVLFFVFVFCFCFSFCFLVFLLAKTGKNSENW